MSVERCFPHLTKRFILTVVIPAQAEMTSFLAEWESARRADQEGR
jgi:hypothetical protein